jgi:RNA polymerase sigma-70 factor (ECF subfamily)
MQTQKMSRGDMWETNKPGQMGAGEEDIALVERVLAGERRAFEPLVRRHERKIFRVVLAVLGNAEDAEEAMQDAFVKAFRHLGQFRRESRFTTWLTRIAINEALQRRRAKKDAVSLDEARDVEEPLVPRRHEIWQTNPEKIYGKQEMRELVESAIQSLPEIYREAFVLRDVEEMSAEEAAEAIGISVPALKSRLLRARLMVRETLAGWLEEPPTLRRKMVHAVTDFGTAVAMRMMRATRR